MNTSKICDCGQRLHKGDGHDRCPACTARVDPQHYTGVRSNCLACVNLSKTAFFDRRTSFSYFIKTGRYISARRIRALKLDGKEANLPRGEQTSLEVGADAVDDSELPVGVPPLVAEEILALIKLVGAQHPLPAWVVTGTQPEDAIKLAVRAAIAGDISVSSREVEYDLNQQARVLVSTCQSAGSADSAVAASFPAPQSAAGSAAEGLRRMTASWQGGGCLP